MGKESGRTQTAGTRALRRQASYQWHSRAAIHPHLRSCLGTVPALSVCFHLPVCLSGRARLSLVIPIMGWIKTSSSSLLGLFDLFPMSHSCKPFFFEQSVTLHRGTHSLFQLSIVPEYAPLSLISSVTPTAEYTTSCTSVCTQSVFFHYASPFIDARILLAAIRRLVSCCGVVQMPCECTQVGLIRPTRKSGVKLSSVSKFALCFHIRDPRSPGWNRKQHIHKNTYSGLPETLCCL